MAIKELIMVMFADIYGVVAFITFMLFMFPVFQDWSDYSAKETCNCALFSVCVGLLWPVVVVLLIALACCRAYYSRKDGKDSPDGED